MSTDGRATSLVQCDGHLVHIYDEEAELAQTVCAHLDDALAGGACAIVIATEEHRRAFDEGVAGWNRGVTALDAQATLDAMTAGGRIDPRLFDEVVGGTLREVASRGKPVCAYGEMVELLWRDGLVVEALELERLWNELQRDLSFSLLCAYRSDTISAPGDADALRHMCQLHSGAGRKFAAEPDAPAQARRFIRKLLSSWNLDDAALDDAQLVLSELTTNAVLHARSPFLVNARAHGDGLTVAVSDQIRTVPRLRTGEPARLSGHGLELVTTVARDWGVKLSGDGKTVWAELKR